MTSQTLLLYGSAVAVIGLLIAFSKSNQKSGWKKSRTTLADALQDLYADLGLSAQLSDPIVASPVDSTDFTSQLVKLRGALGASNPVTTNPAGVNREEPVLARSR